MNPVPPHFGQPPSIPPNPMHLEQVVNLVDVTWRDFSSSDSGEGVEAAGGSTRFP